MAEKIGLEAVLSLGSFSRAVSQYQSSIAGMSKNTASTASSISSSFVGLGSGILKLGAIAGGVALAGVAGLTAGLVLLGSTALTEFARFERATLSIQSLVARELSQGQLVEQQRTVLAGLSKKEAEELEGLAAKINKEELARNTLHARIKEQSEALRQLREAHGDEALDVQTATARLAELENKYNESGTAINNMKNRVVELSGKEGQLVTVMDKVRTGQIDMNTAMEQAGPRAAELITWISKLAVLSPFTEAGIQDAFQTALAYGFTTEAAQRLTEAEVDFAAATGKSVETTNLIALALGQMQAKGKVSGQELIQLTNAGIGVNKILEGMGFTLDDVSNGLVSADSFIEAVIQDMEIFKGAGEAQAQTFSGLISTLSDLKAIGLREFFTGTFTAIQPYLASFVNMLASAALETGSIRALGDAFGVYVAAGLQKVTTFVTKLTGAFSRFGVRGVGVSLLGQLGLDPTRIAGIMGVVNQITGAISRIQGAFERFGLKGAAVSILGMLGMDPETIGTLRTVIDQVTEIVSGFVTQISEFVGNLSFEEIIGGLTGIGAILAGGVFAALVAGILSLLTPINLIIAGAALLGAAWAGNWFGIRDTVAQAWATIQPVLSDLWTWLSTNIPAAIQTVSDIWTNTLKPGFLEIYNVISSQVLPAFQDLWNTLTQGTGGTQTLSGLWTNTLQPALAAVGDFLINTLFPAWVDLEVFLAGALAAAITKLADYWENWLFPAMGKVKDAVGVMADVWTNTLEPAMVTVGTYINDNIVPLFESIGELSNAVVGQGLEALAGIWQKILLPALRKVGDFIRDTILPHFSDVGKEAKEEMGPALEWLANDVLPLLQKGLDLVTEAIKTATGYFSGLADAVKNFSLPDILTPGSPPPFAIALTDIASGAQQAAQAISQMGKNSLSSAGNISRFIDSLNMGNLARGFGGGGSGWKEMRRVITAGFEANFGTLMAGGDPAAILGHIQQVAQRFNFPPSMAAEFAKMNGLVGMVTDKFKAFQKQIAIENLGNLTQIAGSFSSLGSTFADMLQQQMGNADEANKTVEAYKKLGEAVDTDQNKLAKLKEELAVLTTSEGSHQIAIDKKTLAVEKMTESIDFNKRQLAIYEQEIAGMELGTLAWEKKQLQIDKTTESIDAQEKQLVTLSQELEKLSAANNADALAIEKKRLEIEKLTQEMDKNQKAVEDAKKGYEALQAQAFNLFSGNQSDAERIQSELATIALLQDFLKSGDRSLLIPADAESQAAGITGILYDQISGQQELNRLLEEQRRKEEQIIRQKELQQKFDLLKAQVDLRKQAMDLGIALPAGMQFGLNAGIDGMLKTVNDLTEALINQINTNLQISSPSKLMIKTFKQVMAGAAIGMERGQSLLSDAVRSVPILNGTIPQPVFSQPGGAGSSSSTVYNYNFPMTVNTAASPQAVIRQYDIKRSMFAAG